MEREISSATEYDTAAARWENRDEVTAMIDGVGRSSARSTRS